MIERTITKKCGKGKCCVSSDEAVPFQVREVMRKGSKGVSTHQAGLDSSISHVCPIPTYSDW